MGDQGVVALLYGYGQWRQAAAEVLRLAHSWPDSPGRLRQPLIVACGHSLGANAMSKFARLLGQSGLEVSLAVYIDAFSAEKPGCPPMSAAPSTFINGPACSKVCSCGGNRVWPPRPRQDHAAGQLPSATSGQASQGQTETIPPPVLRTTLPAGARRARAGFYCQAVASCCGCRRKARIFRAFGVVAIIGPPRARPRGRWCASNCARRRRRASRSGWWRFNFSCNERIRSRISAPLRESGYRWAHRPAGLGGKPPGTAR